MEEIGFVTPSPDIRAWIHIDTKISFYQYWKSHYGGKMILRVSYLQWDFIYRKTSSISRTKSPNLNVSCTPLQLSSLNSLKPGVKLRMKM